MAPDLTGLLDVAFDERQDLKSAVKQLLAQHPEQHHLFAEICTLISELRSHPNGNLNASDEPPTKKRRLEDGKTESFGSQTTLVEVKDVSFTLPQRKKLHLQFVRSTIGKISQTLIQGVLPASGAVEFSYPFAAYAYAMRLPVPEKQQKSYNFCLIPRQEVSSSAEPILWTVPGGPLKSCTIHDKALAEDAKGPDDILETILKRCLSLTGSELTFPSDKEFVSAVREAHRKGEASYHVKTHKGSKEGFLYFLSSGIFFGFKKPLLFFPFNEIESISYTSVLQRTFNLNITVVPEVGDRQEVEFSMIDQQDFAGIDAYVKSHQLQDASLAEARRAKKVGKEVKTETNGADEDDGRTELEKAQQELEDEEDEMEEDYDPEDEDDGSGSESESDGEEYTRGKGTDLVAQELGSEAEDVSASEDEGEEAQAEDSDAEGEVEDDVEQEKVVEAPKARQQLPSHSARPPAMPDYDDDDQL